jgi:hypothetical protein
MREKKYFLFFILLLPLIVFSEELGKIKGIVRPSRIYLEGDKIFVSDDYRIKIFSNKGFNLIKEIGRKGEGPGEFNTNPRLFLLKDSIFVWTTRKIIWLTKDGEILKEKRLPILPFKILPLKGNFVIFNMEEGFYKISILDGEFKKIKELLQHKIEFSADKFNPLQAIMNFEIYDGKVIVGKGDENLIRIFDGKGNELESIKINLPRFKMEDWFKKEAEEDWKSRGVPSNIKLDFPEYFPLFGTFTIDNKKIYFITYKKENNKFLWIVFDMKGKEIKRVFLPAGETGTIKDDFYYWLEFDEGKEEFILHRLKI